MSHASGSLEKKLRNLNAKGFLLKKKTQTKVYLCKIHSLLIRLVINQN
jgi:hypothetical protein